MGGPTDWHPAPSKATAPQPMPTTVTRRTLRVQNRKPVMSSLRAEVVSLRSGLDGGLGGPHLWYGQVTWPRQNINDRGRNEIRRDRTG